MRPSLALVALLWSPLLLAVPARAADDVAELVLTKSSTGAHPAAARSYTVRPGDTVTRILRRSGVQGSIRPSHLQAFQAANPAVKDLDRIRVGQVLVIPPLDGTGTGTGAAAAGQAERRGGEQPREPAPPVAGTPAFQSVPCLDASPPEGLRLAAKAYEALGETLVGGGALYLPLKGAGTLRLDTDRYPMVSLGSGGVLIFDPRNTVSPAVKDLIEASWPSYRVVRLGDAPSGEEALDRALRASGYHAVSRFKEVTLGGDVRLTLSCDWLVEKTPDSILEDGLYAVNYARHPREVFPEQIVAYAGRRNIRVVNLLATPAGEPPPEPVQPGNAVAESLRSADSLALVDRVLTRLGLPFQRNQEVSVPADGEGGLSATLNARWLVAGPRQLVIGPEELPAPLAALLAERGFDHLAIDGRLPPGEAVAALLTALRLEHTAPTVVLSPAGTQGKEKFSITLPGVFLRRARESLLFTRVAPDELILAFLASRGVRVILF
jgi:hypothetical protein